MCLSGDRFPADLAPVQELLLQIALGIQLAGVDQLGDEQEHIPGPHALLLQMPLRSAGPSEYAPPSLVPPDGILPDIGVPVNSIPCVQAAPGKVFNHLPGIDVAVIQVPVVNCRVVITGDGQRINRAIGENGAGAASIRTVEPFSAER